MTPYTAEAYAAKKYAFVSDFARFWVLYECGGIYFDTDVEIIRPIEDIIAKGSFMGAEDREHVNPGLGMCMEQRNPLCQWYISYFSDKHFTSEQPSMIPVITRKMKELGWKDGSGLHVVIFESQSVNIYPPPVFSPKNFTTGKITITSECRSIHHFSMSWFDVNRRNYQRLTQLFSRFIEINKAKRYASICATLIFILIIKPYNMVLSLLKKCLLTHR